MIRRFNFNDEKTPLMCLKL